MKKKSPVRVFHCIISAIILLVFNSCNNSTEYQRGEGLVWNTLYHITYKGPDNLRDSILPVLDKVGKSLSVFDKTSLVSKLNENDSVIADESLIAVYEMSRKINELSGRNFDPTLSPLINAWGFGVGHKSNPDTLAIDSILRFVGIEKTFLKGDVIFKTDIRTQFNFSAIAKGYGCDAVGEMLRRNGVEDYMVEIGGEISLHGKSPSGRDWKISIDSPDFDDNVENISAMIISLTDKGIATSGNYRNYRNENGNRISHTISPKTGRPFASEILSATVISSTCMEADGLATACMASSPEEAKEILNKSGADGLLIFEDSVWTTPGFRRYVSEEVSEPGRTGRN